jgi:hypothetical protein
VFEVIISQVKTGRVERRQFGTREEAEQYLACTEERLLTPRPNRKRIPSLSDYRFEVQYREPVAAPLTLPQRRRAAA